MMRVLVLEAEPGSAKNAIAELEAEGHSVVRCHEAGMPAFPCSGLTGASACPLEGEGVDVALTVRTFARSVPSAHEDGAACALRARVPLVVAGEAGLNPYAGLGATAVGGRDINAVLNEVVRDSRPEHSQVALAALQASMLANGESSEGLNARVWRTKAGLHAVIEMPEATPNRTRDLAAVRVTGALRAYDSNAPQIDVSVEPI